MEGGGLHPGGPPRRVRTPGLREEGAGFLGLKEGRAGALTVSVPEWILKLNPLSVQVFEIRTTDDLTEAWLKEKLSFFR